MIRGAIEIVRPTEVCGWLFCSAASVRDQTVLAFIGTRCIGSANIDIYRPDLRDAGLGDGFCGFTIPVQPVPGGLQNCIMVRLENSDVSLLQPDAPILTHAEAMA
jgi:hypothetical protein